MKYLQSKGYKVFPVNPVAAGQEILGEVVYPSLDELPEQVDMVDIFRKSEDAGEITDQAILHGAKIIWMQLGVINNEAAARAEEKRPVLSWTGAQKLSFLVCLENYLGMALIQK